MAESRAETFAPLPYPTRRARTASASARLLRYAPPVVLYVLVTYFTEAFFMGDTMHYVELIMDAPAALLSDFGHLLWLLSGQTLWHAMQAAGGPADRGNLLTGLITLCWLAGLASTVFLYDLALRIGQCIWIALLVTAAFVWSQGFLDYAHTGCAYVPGLAFFLFGLWLVFRHEDGRSLSSGIGAGVAFAVAIGIWFPYALAVPGALAVPLLIYGWSKDRFRSAARTSVALALTAAAVYVSAAAAQGIYTLHGLLAWVSSSSHGITTAGFSRMVFGFSRSFVNMGNDGVLFKRFLLHDPFNPVSLVELMRVSLGKLALVYLFFAVVFLALAASTKGRRYVAFVGVSALPVCAFAWSWQGGDMERYLPLYPALFVSLAYALSDGPWARFVQWAAVLFAVFLVAVNLGPLSRSAAERRQADVERRIDEIQLSWKPGSHIATVLWQDDITSFYWNYPFNPINRSGILSQPRGDVPVVFDIVDRNSPNAPRWRQIFAADALAVWSRGGDMWVSKEAFSPRPRPDSAWVEGDDPTVSWSDVPRFFTSLDTARSVGGENGFLLLAPSPHNRRILAQLAAKEN
jgi:hypothetical protein